MSGKLIHGWQPDLPDYRDFAFKIVKPVKTPTTCDLRKYCPKVYDQGDLGSCTANAIGAAVEVNRIKAKQPDWMPSRLFIYYNERAMEGTIRQDAGAQIRNGIKSLAKLGVCPEKQWPYDPDKFTTKPTKACFAKALDNQALRYQRVAQDPGMMEQILFGGKPIVFGFSVYTAFEEDEVEKTGILKLPGKKEKLLGGHAVLAVGYDRPKKRFLVRNSWGSDWGLGGYFWMPYDYVCDSNLADDLWVIDTME